MGVLRDDRLDHLVGDRHLVLPEAVALALPRPEVPVRDRDLLVGRVAVEADHLHPVEQRPGDRVGLITGRDEDHVGEIDLDIEVVVAEGRVLSRVEHLEQRGRRIAAPVGADLVDLVEQNHRVHRLRIPQRADEASRQGTDVGAAVTPDLGLVADAAERHADELAVQRPGDRLANRRLAGAGRADQGQDRARLLVDLDPPLLTELAHGDVLDNAVLDVLEPGMVGVEHLTARLWIEPLLGADAPRHCQQPVDVTANRLRLG